MTLNPANPVPGAPAPVPAAPTVSTPPAGPPSPPSLSGSDAAAEMLRQAFAAAAPPVPSSSAPEPPPASADPSAPGSAPATGTFDLAQIKFDGEEAVPAPAPEDDLDPDKILAAGPEDEDPNPDPGDADPNTTDPEKLSRKEANKVMGAFLRTPRGQRMHGAFKAFQTLQEAGVNIDLTGATPEELQAKAQEAAQSIQAALTAQRDWTTFRRDLQEAPERAAQFLFTGFQTKDGRYVPPAVAPEFVSVLPAMLAETNPEAFQALSAPVIEHVVESLFAEALEVKPVSKVHVEERLRLLEHALETERRLFPDRFVLNDSQQWVSKFRQFDQQGNMRIDQAGIPSAPSAPSTFSRRPGSPAQPVPAPGQQPAPNSEAERYRQALERERQANLQRATTQFDSAYNGLMTEAGRTLESDIAKVLSAFPGMASYPETVKQAMTNHLYDKVNQQVFNSQSTFQQELDRQIQHARQNFLKTGSLDLTAPKGMLIRTIRETLRSVGPNILKSLQTTPQAPSQTASAPSRPEPASGSPGATVQNGIPLPNQSAGQRAEAMKQELSKRLPGETAADAATRALRATLAS